MKTMKVFTDSELQRNGLDEDFYYNNTVNNDSYVSWNIDEEWCKNNSPESNYKKVNKYMISQGAHLGELVLIWCSW